jgi:SEC-C motif domain protein
MANRETCPCGSGASFSACCGRYLDGNALPDTAERLMRSRYTAYVKGQEEYLRRTWHGSTCPTGRIIDGLPVKWLGLEILGCADGAGGTGGTVEFVACYKIDGRAARLHEVSHFVCEDGRWLYVDGTHITARDRN